MVNPKESDLDIVFGRWDFDIQDAITTIKAEIENGGRDIIDKMIEMEKVDKMHYCSNCELFEEVSGNWKYSKDCKSELTKFDALEGDEEDKDIIEKEDISAVYKLKIINNDEKCQPTQVHLEKVKDKQILFSQYLKQKGVFMWIQTVLNVLRKCLKKFKKEQTHMEMTLLFWQSLRMEECALKQENCLMSANILL